MKNNMNNEERYMKVCGKEPLILEPEDWTEDEWNTFLKVFNLKSASRIKLACEFEAFGIKNK